MEQLMLSPTSACSSSEGNLMTAATGGVRRARLAALLVLAVGLAAASAACSSSGGGAAPSSLVPPATSIAPASSPAGGSSADSPEAMVATHRGSVNKFVAAGPSLDAASVKGGSLWYVPISAELPNLAVTENGIHQAAQALGMTLQVCDGKLQPAAAAACINSAVSAGADGIMTDSILPSMVITAVANATQHKIPLLALDDVGTDSAYVRYFGQGDPLAQRIGADWIIADSNGSAHVTLTKALDDPGTLNTLMTGSVPEFKSNCPNCTVYTATFTTGTVAQVPSIISSALQVHSDVNYGFPEYDFLVPLFKSGAQTAGLATKLKIVSTQCALSSMKLIESGGQAADTCSNRNYGGWAATDAMLRMILGQPAPTNNTIPVRLFDKENIGEVTLTNDDSMSGRWFGDLSYQAGFSQLWGLG
jgi:ribose transport system substrate-binding protein